MPLICEGKEWLSLKYFYMGGLVLAVGFGAEPIFMDEIDVAFS